MQTFALAGAFERRTANEIKIPNATNDTPIELMIIPSSSQFEYFFLRKKNKIQKSLIIHKNLFIKAFIKLTLKSK